MENKIRLSIGIPTVLGRETQCNALVYLIQLQIDESGLKKEVELFIDKDNKDVSIGAKRDRMYKRSKGLFSVQIDDDDMVPTDYVKTIFEATKNKVDCIGYKERCIFDGMHRKVSDISFKYAEWKQFHIPINGIHHQRTPFFKTPILTYLCQMVGVKDMRFGEDHDFANRILPFLKTEHYIDREMYIYQYKSEPHNQKYGIVR